MKKKWYRGTGVKGFLFLAAHISAVIVMIGAMTLASHPGMVEEQLSGTTTTYEESGSMASTMYSDSMAVLVGIKAKENLETKGVYDEDKLVDIVNLTEQEQINGKNENGIAYRLGDMTDWAMKLTNNEVESSEISDTMEDPIIVCKKPDGTFSYYYYSEFKTKISDGNFRFVMATEDCTSEELLAELRNSTLYEGDYENTGSKAVLNENGDVLYTDCWNYDGEWVEELYTPDGAESILDIVNENETFNGNLSGMFAQIKKALYLIESEKSDYDTLKDGYDQGTTNFSYVYVDRDNEKVYTNLKDSVKYKDADKLIQALNGKGTFIHVSDAMETFDTNLKHVTKSDWIHGVKETGTADTFEYIASVDTTYPLEDYYYTESQSYAQFEGKAMPALIAAIVGTILFLICFVWLTVVTGRSTEDEELHLIRFDHWKTEIAAGIVFGVWICVIAVMGELLDSLWYAESGRESIAERVGDVGLSFGIGTVVVILTCVLFFFGWLSLVRRIKARTLWKDSFLRWMIHGIGDLFRNFSIVWRGLLVFGAFTVAQWAMFSTSGMGCLIGLAALAAGVVFVYRKLVARKALEDGIKRIASGDVEYKIPTDKLKGADLAMAEQINSIGEGLDAALEDSMRSERLKTDLITNVSHDIKTPLTSIINYVDLLKRENFEDPKIVGYLEILDAKSQQLKTLTNDVVEASRASSGNITLECAKLNLGSLIRQTSGEFAEKFEARGLEEVLNLPKEPAIIWADGRRMWRILENLYHNAAKYTMPNTRVYADLTVKEGKVRFSLKNISEQALNISAEELTERFIRGDISRNTEGSGLGLSIARSLTELQGGQFDIYLDGDLFRVTLTFDQCTETGAQ